MLLRRALTENGDMNSLSNDSERAISAIAFAVICSRTESRSPSHCNGRTGLDHEHRSNAFTH